MERTGMQRHHLTGCVVAIVAALAIFAATGGSIGGLGLLLATLVCPLTMGIVMWFLMGPGHRTASQTPAPDAHEARP